MEELDLLKKAWKKENGTFNQFSEKEIYHMLQKRSSSIVKWILIISILEVLLWTSLGIVLHTDDYLDHIKMENGNLLFSCLNYFNYAVTVVFIYLFYRNYVNISTTVSTQKLMSDILKTRKMVNWYVGYNLAMMCVGLLLGFFLAYNFNPEVEKLRLTLNDGHHNAMIWIMLLILVCFIATCLFIFWLFYRLVYGILLRKLYRNYNELKQIDFK
ncbi:MAG: hypothetical protein EOO01_24420 [Chitinophagaceae bacterium]|nr:MAG: hypothetical protein EOO01_24420 [Chitinophagaceae bacterium]